MIDDAFVLGWKGFTQEELEGAVLRWLILDWTGHSTKQMKLQTVWLSGYGRGVESPTAGMLDKPGYLLCRRYAVWLKRLLRTSKSVTLGCPYSKSDIASETLLLGSKRGAPSVEDDLVLAANSDYLKHMSVPRPISAYGPQIRSALWETCREVFGEISEVEPMPFLPSRRAGYGAPIARGGIIGDLVRSDPSLLSGEELVSMVDSRRVWEVRGCHFDWRRAWLACLSLWGDKRTEELAKCQVYTIREPLKLRTITAGTPSLYGSLQVILARLRQGMSKFDVFRLTRKENNAAWLSDRMNVNPLRRHLGFLDWDHFASGDYQQSTNDLSMEATDICRYYTFSGAVSRVVDAALGAQVIVAPTESGDSEVVQERGQLMGSPLSFPFLCVINAAIARLAYCMVHRELFGKRLDAFPFAVNGDDIVARMSPQIYEMWVSLIGAVGWLLSPGKSYFLQDLAQVNSQTMRITRIRRPGELTVQAYLLENPIPFVNSGFLQQMNKSTQQIDGSVVEAMSLDWRERWSSYERLPVGMRERARSVLLQNLGEMCEQLAESGMTPFVLRPSNPIGLGGFGLPGPFDWKAAFFGSLCCEPERSTLQSLIWTEGMPPRETRPLLVWKDPAVVSYGSLVRPSKDWRQWCPKLPNKDKVSEILLRDLEDFVHREELPDLKLPVGLVAPRML
jgi:hypothetical protein